MSRLPFGNIWTNHVGYVDAAVCPLCNVNVMVYEDRTTWNRYHMFPVSGGGSDVYPNVIAACKKCNDETRNMTVFEYMVSKERWTPEQAQQLQKECDEKIQSFDPICEHVDGMQKKCRFRKFSDFSKWCGKHHDMINGVAPMDID